MPGPFTLEQAKSRISPLVLNPFSRNAATQDQYDEQRLAKLLPTEKDVAASKAEQESQKSSIVWDILDFPSMMFGQHSIMGGLADLANGVEGTTVVKNAFRDSIFGFFADKLGLDNLVFGEEWVQQKRTTRDVRLAMGETEVDEGWNNTIINLLGDIAFDFSTYATLGFSSLSKVSKAARTALQEALPTLKGLSGVEKFEKAAQLVQKVPGLVMDPAIAQGVREAVTLYEKVQTKTSALWVYKVPLIGEGNVGDLILPRNFQLWTAEKLSNAADFLRASPVTGPLIRVFNPTALGAEAGPRHIAQKAFEESREVQNKITADGIGMVRGLEHRLSKAGVEMDREGNRLVVDLIELNAKDFDDAISLERKFEQGYLYQSNLERARRLKADPDFKKTMDLAKSGNMEALKTVYDSGFPLSRQQLDRLGLPPRVGVDIGGQRVDASLLSEKLQDIAAHSGVTPEALPITESLTNGLKPGMGVQQSKRNIILGASADVRIKRLKDWVSENGNDAFDALKEYAIGMGDILKRFGQEEKTVGLLNNTLELYFPRMISDGARTLLEDFMPRKIKEYFGEGGLTVMRGFMEGRKFTDLSTNDVNSLMLALGSKKTEFNPIQQMAEFFMSDRAFVRKLRKTDPDAWEWFKTDVTSVVAERATQSARARGKKAFVDALFDEDFGIAREVSDSRDVAGIVNRMKAMEAGTPEALVPVIKSKRAIGFQEEDVADTLGNAWSNYERSRVRVVKRAIYGHINDMLDATKNDVDAVTAQVKNVRDIKPNGNLDISNTDDALSAMKKTHLQARRDLKTDIKRVTAQQSGVAKAPGSNTLATVEEVDGNLTFQVRNTEALTTKAYELVDQYQRTADELIYRLQAQAKKTGGKGYDTSKNELKQKLKKIAQSFNKDLSESLTDEGVNLKTQLQANYRRVNEIDSEIEGALEQLGFQRKGIVAGAQSKLKSVAEAVAEARKGRGGAEFHAELEAFAKDPDIGMKAFEDPQALLGELHKAEGHKVFWVDRQVLGSLRGFLKSVYSTDPLKVPLAAFDRLTSWWKRNTVLPFPQSRARDIVSNFTMLAVGGFRHPSAVSDAMDIRKQLGSYLKGEVDDVGQALKDLTIKISDTESMSAADLVRTLQGKGMIGSGLARDEFEDTIVDMWRSTRVRKPGETIKALANPVNTLDLHQLMAAFTGATKDVPSRSLFVKAGYHVAEYGDDIAKMAGVIDALRRGMPLQDAVEHVKGLVWNPATTLMSPVERFGARRIIPFYGWTKHVTKTALEQYAERPGWFTALNKIHNQAQATLGTSDFNEDLLATKIVHDRLGIPISKSKKGVSYLLFDGYLPLADVPQIASAFLGLVPGSGVPAKTTLNWLGERLNPMLREGLEQAIGQEFYSQRDIEQFEGERGEMFGIPMSKGTRKLLSNLRFLKSIDDLNVFNLGDVNKIMSLSGDAVERQTPKGAEPPSLLARYLTGPLGLLPKDRKIDVPTEVRRAEVNTKIDLGRAKAALKRSLDDKRPQTEENRQVLRKIMADRQAKLLRLDEERGRFEVGE